MSYLIFMLFLILIIALGLGLYIFICKNEKLEQELDEKQDLINASRKALLLSEDRVTQRNKMIEYQQEKNKKLEEKLTLLKTYINSNNYGNAEVRLQKLKELARPGNQH